MKKILLALAASTALAAPAMAADLGRPIFKAPVAAEYFSWNGFYLGVQGGYGWGRHDRDTAAFHNSYVSDGGVLGVHAGYNWQAGMIVLGGEFDIAGARIRGNDRFAGGTLDVTRVNGIGTARGRIGLAWDRLLVYGTGGAAYADVEQSNAAGVPVSSKRWVSGWTAGAGFQYAINNNWSAGLEYRYYDLETENYVRGGLAAFAIDTKFSTVTGRITYRFGTWGAPIIASY